MGDGWHVAQKDGLLTYIWGKQWQNTNEVQKSKHNEVSPLTSWERKRKKQMNKKTIKSVKNLLLKILSCLIYNVSLRNVQIDKNGSTLGCFEML